MSEFLTWVWLHVVLPSWISLAAAPFVLIGYWRLGRGRREGWWCLIASQGWLLAIAVVDQQFGLILIAVPVAIQAFWNWQRWGRPEGARA